jgi:hypothetical protein
MYAGDFDSGGEGRDKHSLTAGHCHSRLFVPKTPIRWSLKCLSRYCAGRVRSQTIH